MSAFIEERKADFGVEPICQTLGVSASAYYQRATGERSERSLEDEWLLAQIRRVHEDNYECYGSRRVWKALLREGIEVARCTVERLMSTNGIQGAKRRGKPWRTTTPDPAGQDAPDLVERDFAAETPNRLWVVDFTYLRTWEGVVFFAFVIDVFSRMIVGWQFATHMRRTLVLDALRMALGLRAPGADAWLVHHSDRGSQPRLNRSSQHHDERSCDGSKASTVRFSGPAAVVLAGSSGGASRAAAAVLGRDRSWSAERGRGRRGRSVSSGWCPVVSRGWRDAHCHPGPAVGALPVLRRTRRDRDPARPRVWRAGDRALARAFTLDDLARAAPQCRHAQRRLEYRATTAQWHADRERGVRRRRSSPPTTSCEATSRTVSRARSSGRTGPRSRAHRYDGSAGVTAAAQDRRWARAWSPSRSRHRLSVDFPDDEAMRISHEAIYQALYVQGRGALRRELTACLRTGRALRVPRARSRARGKGFVSEEILISERPAEAEDRRCPDTGRAI